MREAWVPGQLRFPHPASRFPTARLRGSPESPEARPACRYRTAAATPRRPRRDPAGTARTSPARTRHRKYRTRTRSHAKLNQACRGAPRSRNPARHGAAVRLVRRAELPPEQGLLYQDDEQMKQHGERDAVLDQSYRAVVERPTGHDGEHSEVHGIAYAAVQTPGDERGRGVDR